MRKYFYPVFTVFTCLALSVLSAIVFKLYTQQNIANLNPQLHQKATPKAISTTPAMASYSSTVLKTAPAVVNIFTTQKMPAHPMMNDPFFERFFGNQMPQQQPNSTSLGSGVIVSTNGYILTNNHVIEKADTIVVALQDGRNAKAKIVGTDPESDVAVLQIDLPNLPSLLFRSNAVSVGDVVLAIGNPFGVGQTVTQGIISAVNRSDLGINTFENFIQTDAAINPGNSGGALVDVAGNLVGINTAIFSKSGGSMGIGFAIPSEVAQSVMNSIIANGHVERGWLGVEVKDLNPSASSPAEAAMQQLNDDNEQVKRLQGVQIMGVVKGGPADKAGIQPGDVVVSLNGKTVTSAKTLVRLIANISPKDKADIGLLRNGSTSSHTVIVGERPQQSTADNSSSSPMPQGSNPTLQLPPQLERFLFGR